MAAGVPRQGYEPAHLPPEFKTFEEFEVWRKSRDLIGDIERRRKEATAARERTAAAEGRVLPSPPMNGTHG